MCADVRSKSSREEVVSVHQHLLSLFVAAVRHVGRPVCLRHVPHVDVPGSGGALRQREWRLGALEHALFRRAAQEARQQPADWRVVAVRHGVQSSTPPGEDFVPSAAVLGAVGGKQRRAESMVSVRRRLLGCGSSAQVQRPEDFQARAEVRAVLNS
eukprot:6079068-Prymnesium_polylepis.3